MERKIYYHFRSENTGHHFSLPTRDIDKNLSIGSIIVSEGYSYTVKNILIINDKPSLNLTFIVEQNKILGK